MGLWRRVLILQADQVAGDFDDAVRTRVVNDVSEV